MGKVIKKRAIGTSARPEEIRDARIRFFKSMESWAGRRGLDVLAVAESLFASKPFEEWTIGELAIKADEYDKDVV